MIVMALAAVCCGVSAQDTVRMSLDSCLRYAYSHNLSVQAAGLTRESAQVALTGAKLNFLPSVSASASKGISWADQTTHSNNVGVSGSLTLFDGLASWSAMQQSRLTAERGELAQRQAENSVGAQIVSAYLTIMMNEEKLAYEQEVLETSRRQKEEGELKSRVGRILESDYRLLEANHISAEAEIENTRLTIEGNRLTLRTLMCLSGDTVVEPEAGGGWLVESREWSLDSVLAMAERAMPDWQINRLDVDIARTNVDLARAAFLPTLSLNAGASYSDGVVTSIDPHTIVEGSIASSVTLGVSVPILNRGNSLTQLKQSKINLRQAEVERRQKELALREEIESHYLNTRQALNRYRSTEALADAYRGSYEVYVIKYGEGAVTTVEMLQQQDKYLSALNDYLQSKYSYLLAEKQLDIYIGKEIKL